MVWKGLGLGLGLGRPRSTASSKERRGEDSGRLIVCVAQVGGKPCGPPPHEKLGPTTAGPFSMLAPGWSLTAVLLQPVLWFLLPANALQAWEMEKRPQTCHDQMCASATLSFPRLIL